MCKNANDECDVFFASKQAKPLADAARDETHPARRYSVG